MLSFRLAKITDTEILKCGYREAETVPCIFNGIIDVQLVCLENKL